MNRQLLVNMRPGPSTATSDEVLFERLMRERIVYLASEVDDEVAHRITSQLLLLAAEDPSRDITFYINSPGGSVTAGMAIYDTMQHITPDVATWAMGFAASMGQFLLSSGTRGKRHALPHARVLMHQPSAGFSGAASDVKIRAEAFGSMKRELAQLTAEQTGQTVEQVTADADRDRWFTAKEALEYGFIDHVVRPSTISSSRPAETV